MSLNPSEGSVRDARSPPSMAAATAEPRVRASAMAKCWGSSTQTVWSACSWGASMTFRAVPTVLRGNTYSGRGCPSARCRGLRLRVSQGAGEGAGSGMHSRGARGNESHRGLRKPPDCRGAQADGWRGNRPALSAICATILWILPRDKLVDATISIRNSYVSTWVSTGKRKNA